MRPIAVAAVLALLAACATQAPAPRQFDVFFQVNEAKLTPEGEQIVANIVAAVRDSRPSQVVVEGQANGSSPRDAQLADQRATVVTTALKTAGVDAAKISQHAALLRPAQPDAATHVATHKVTVQLVP